MQKGVQFYAFRANLKVVFVEVKILSKNLPFCILYKEEKSSKILSGGDIFIGVLGEFMEILLNF